MSVVVVGGPTAAGKSAVALDVAERVGGEIVCADSRQIYAGFPIAAASPTDDERARVPHHLYGVVDAAKAAWSVADYVSAANAVVDDIVGRGKVAVVVGGSGLYLRSLRLGLDEGLPTDPAVRAQLDLDLRRDGLAALVARLRALDASGGDVDVDVMNPVRVVRALEIALLGGDLTRRSIAALLARAPLPRFAAARFVIVDRTDLPERIERRTRAMFDAGVFHEASAFAAVVGDAHPLLGTMGLAEARAVSLNSMLYETAIERACARTRQYARRQRTWFRKEPWWTPFTSVDDVVSGLVSSIASR